VAQFGDAGGHRDGAEVVICGPPLEHARGDFLANLVEHGCGLLGPFAREDQSELLAAVAGGEAGRRAYAADDAGDVANDLVASLVTPGIVEGLEVIDVDEG
jgi:hypothetical protein